MAIFPPSSFDEELCDRIMQEDRAAGRGTDRIPDLPGNPIVAGWHELLIVLYRILTTVNNGLPPIPDLLLRLGRAGRWIHRVTCQRRGGWEAFRRSVARRFPEIAYPTSLVEGQHTLTSYAERLVLRWLLTLSGIHEPVVHPKLCGSSLYADFLITAVTGRSAYVEVVGMLESAESTGRDGHCAGYHARLVGKIETYRALALDLPVLIFVEDLTPWGLETKRAEILARLGLPS